MCMHSTLKSPARFRTHVSHFTYPRARNCLYEKQESDQTGRMCRLLYVPCSRMRKVHVYATSISFGRGSVENMPFLQYACI